MPDSILTCNIMGHVARLKPGLSGDTNSLATALAETAADINGDINVYAVILEINGGIAPGSLPGNPAAAIASIEKPVIAAVAGNMAGPALEMALAADIRIASEDATFAMPQVAEGCLPHDGGTQRLPRIVGRGKAMELLLAAATLDASEAMEIGLVSRLSPPEKLADEAMQLAGEIAAKGPVALRYIKEAVNKGMDMTLEQGLRLEADLYFLIHTTADRTEGVQSFREKRKPEFKGE